VFTAPSLPEVLPPSEVPPLDAEPPPLLLLALVPLLPPPVVVVEPPLEDEPPPLPLRLGWPPFEEPTPPSATLTAAGSLPLEQAEQLRRTAQMDFRTKYSYGSRFSEASREISRSQR
jgi:hypothetical protein